MEESVISVFLSIKQCTNDSFFTLKSWFSEMHFSDFFPLKFTIYAEKRISPKIGRFGISLFGKMYHFVYEKLLSFNPSMFYYNSFHAEISNQFHWQFIQLIARHNIWLVQRPMDSRQATQCICDSHIKQKRWQHQIMLEPKSTFQTAPQQNSKSNHTTMGHIRND